MAVSRRLRQLHDAAELGDRQLMAVEQQQDAAARRVGQRRQGIEDCGRARIHPYNRMKGYNDEPCGVKITLGRTAEPVDSSTERARRALWWSAGLSSPFSLPRSSWPCSPSPRRGS